LGPKKTSSVSFLLQKHPVSAVFLANSYSCPPYQGKGQRTVVWGLPRREAGIIELPVILHAAWVCCSSVSRITYLSMLIGCLRFTLTDYANYLG